MICCNCDPLTQSRFFTSLTIGTQSNNANKHINYFDIESAHLGFIGIHH